MVYNIVMLTTISHTKKYTEVGQCFQLVLPISFNVLVPEDDSVRLLSQFTERLNFERLYKAYSPRGRKPAVDPKNLFKVLTYAYMNNIYSTRKIEKACRRDINFMWLLEGEKAPDHSTISRFRSLVFSTVALDLFYQVVQQLHEIGEVAYENLFLDGSKFEANANRYTFVWKKAVNKYEAAMHEKIQKDLEKLNACYGTNFAFDYESRTHDLKLVLEYLTKKKSDTGIEFVHGTGSRKTELQRQMESFQNYLERQETYDQHAVLLDGRNSYSKTDTDATFMRMKDDHMRNGQLKPAYNVQLGVEGEYITGLGLFPDRNDTTTMIPMLEEMRSYLGVSYRNVIADSGYESEENYKYLEQHGQGCYIKPQNYERSKTKKSKNAIGRWENMQYDPEKDEYTCHAGRVLKPINVRKRTSKTGYQTEVTVYGCESCEGCTHEPRCKKGTSDKLLYISKDFLESRQSSQENITSPVGVLLRMNRSIQVEGAFGVLKNDYGFRQFLSRGKHNVLAEMVFLGIAYNVNKLHAKIQNGRLKSPLHPVKNVG